MGSVVVDCPVTGKTVPVGIETDVLTFHKIKALNATARFICPICGMDHVWRSAEARLIDDAPRRKASSQD